MKPLRHPSDAALSRLEVLALLAVLGLLAAVVLPALAGGKPRSDVAVCANNLRQLGQAALMYSMEQGGEFPPRSSTNRWPQRLFPYYGSLSVLRCPTDVADQSTFGGPAAFPADSAPRSYLINGFNDYYAATFPASWQIAATGFGVPEASIPQPSQTILFGEKVSFSGDFWMDMQFNDDLSELEQARHGARRAGPFGRGANHTMVDGSVRTLLFGQGFSPTNLWAVMDLWRTNSFGP